MFTDQYHINSGPWGVDTTRGCLLFICYVSVPLTEARRQRLAVEEAETRRTSSRGLIPRAKVKTIKMTFVIIFG